MAIIDNRVTEDGDVLIIKPEIPIVGLISLYNFVDTTQGESETDYFRKEFRYSLNGGVGFSEWLELNILNISEIEITKQNQFVLEYRYTRVGNTPEIDLEFEDILVSGTFEELPYPIYNTTFFKDFFEINNINVFGWALNVLEKLYNSGILPEYMIRGKSSNNLEDQDFLNFWNTITHYFAIIVYYARQYRDISSNEILLREFLKSRGLEIGNIEFEDIITIFNNYIEEFRNRGTNKIFLQKSGDNSVNGEFLRLINFLSPEEFIISVLQNYETGWCVGKSSPCWKGTNSIINVIKGYEFTREVLDLSKYPLINESYISLDNNDILISNVPDTEISGIYPSDDTKRIVVNKNLDYQISFFVTILEENTEISFGVKGYDSNGNNVNLLSVLNGVQSNDFFTNQTFKITDTVYWIRGVIYNQNKTIDITSTFPPNGKNLKFNPLSNIKYIVPKIVLDNSNSISPNGIRLSNIKIRPLNTPFTLGQLGIHNIILSYLKNNNAEYSLPDFENKIKTELLPANSFLKIKYL